MSLEKRVFLICPVRDVTEEEKKFIDNYVAGLEADGYKVHNPHRDTNQNDPIGYKICGENRKAIIEADEVHIYFKPKSKGTLFDLGMAFMSQKPVKLINREQIKPSPEKSFENVLLELDKLYREKDK